MVRVPRSFLWWEGAFLLLRREVGQGALKIGPEVSQMRVKLPVLEYFITVPLGRQHIT